MAKQKAVVLRKPVLRNNMALTDSGEEIIDPVPHAVTIGVRPQPSIEERIKSMLKQREIEKDPNFGLDSDDDDDFEVGSESPLYEFEKRHDEIMELEKALFEAKEEMANAKEEYKQKIIAGKAKPPIKSSEDKKKQPASSEPKGEES